MKKEISFGKHAVYSRRKINEITVELELKEDKLGRPVFTASGNVWNLHHTDIVMGGQCLEEIGKYVRSKLFNRTLRLWRKYHLNGMKAGTPEQEAFLKEKQAQGWRYKYEEACELLKEAGLNPVELDGKPYYYGHAWLYRPIPENDLEEIKSIIEAGGQSGEE